jgi:hypothetical protein
LELTQNELSDFSILWYSLVAEAGDHRKMWTETTQPQYRRDGQRYASDVSDAEWAQIAALLPAVKKLGRPRTTTLRAVVNALLYLLTTGCQWRLLPKESICSPLASRTPATRPAARTISAASAAYREVAPRPAATSAKRDLSSPTGSLLVA